MGASGTGSQKGEGGGAVRRGEVTGAVRWEQRGEDGSLKRRNEGDARTLCKGKYNEKWEGR